MLNPINVLREAYATLDADVSSDAANTLISAAKYLKFRMSLEEEARNRRNRNRKARHEAMLDCGLVRVRVNGKTFYE